MALNDLLTALENGESVTPVTPRNPDKVTAEPLPNKACTLVTPVTPQIINAEDEARIARWLLSFVEANELTVLFVPPATQADVLGYYPDAVAAEPIPDRPQRKATKAEADELTALVAAIYANDTDDDRAEALAAALADPDGALLCYRTIAEDRGITPAVIPDDRRTCRQCQNLQGRACSIAKPGGVVSANRGYQPKAEILMRCAGYQPSGTDTDQRLGGERWPGLADMKGAK